VVRASWRLFAGGAAGQAGAVLKLLQAFAWVRCWILGAIKVDQVVLLPIGAGAADLLAELLQGAVAELLSAFARAQSWILGAIEVDQLLLLAIGAGGCEGLLVKGLPGSRSGADPACWRAPNG